MCQTAKRDRCVLRQVHAANRDHERFPGARHRGLRRAVGTRRGHGGGRRCRAGSGAARRMASSTQIGAESRQTRPDADEPVCPAPLWMKSHGYSVRLRQSPMRKSPMGRDPENGCDGRSADRSPSQMPVAIVGYSHRMPGGICSDSDFWRLLREREIIQEPISDRYGKGVRPIGGFSGPGRFASPYEGLIRDNDERQFDPTFFGVSHNELIKSDPQVRLLLNCAWETIEHVGWSLQSLRNSPTGVFIGAQLPSVGNWRPVLGASEYSVTGTSLAMLANRISYQFNLMGVFGDLLYRVFCRRECASCRDERNLRAGTATRRWSGPLPIWAAAERAAASTLWASSVPTANAILLTPLLTGICVPRDRLSSQ